MSEINRRMTNWIEIKYHEATEEDKRLYGDECEFVWDCPLPDDMQGVLITDNLGDVYLTYFNVDIDLGSYFENYVHEEVVAWMPLPESFKKARENE